MDGEKNSTRIILPLVLIGFGLLLLLNNLNLLPGGFWNTLIRLWPIILILAGLNDLLRHQRIAGPIILVALGGLLLLANFGLLSVSAWEILFRLWPLIFIAIGLDILLARRAWWLSALITIGFLGIFAFALYNNGAFRFSPESIRPETNFSEPLDDIEQAAISLTPGVGFLKLDDLAETGIIIEGSLPESEFIVVEKSLQAGGSSASYQLALQSGTGPVSFTGGDLLSWDLSLTREIPLDVNLDMGVGTVESSLAQLELTGLQVNHGVGFLDLTLPRTGDFSGKISGGIGQVTLRVPEGLAVKITTDTGIVFVQASGSWEREAETYATPGFNNAPSQVDLTVDQGIGILIIEQIPAR